MFTVSNFKHNQIISNFKYSDCNSTIQARFCYNFFHFFKKSLYILERKILISFGKYSVGYRKKIFYKKMTYDIDEDMKMVRKYIFA